MVISGGFAKAQPPDAAHRCLVTVTFEQEKPKKLKQIYEQYYDSSGHLIEELDTEPNEKFLGTRYYYKDSLLISVEPIATTNRRPRDYYLYEGNNLLEEINHLGEGSMLITHYTYRVDGQLDTRLLRHFGEGLLYFQQREYFLYDTLGRKNRNVVINNNKDTIIITDLFYDNIPNTTLKVEEKDSYTYRTQQFITLDNAGNKIKIIYMREGEFSHIEECTYNAASKLLTRRLTDKYGRVSTDSLNYDSHNRLIRRESITHRQERDINTYRNNLPQSEEAWREGKLYSTIRYHYIPFKKTAR